MDIDEKVLAERIDEAIEGSGLTGAEVARRTGLGQHMISGYRSGKRVPGLLSLVRIAHVVGVSLDALVAPRGRRPRKRAAAA